ncbi:MAG: TPM domain-containing protein [Verrucomicrobiales bacterium]|nr:TPM domain-containing protein [Verrucomicrobiales bacterium]
MKIIVLTLLFFTFQLPAVAQKGIPNAPDPPRLVNDFAGILSEFEEAKLEHDLRTFEEASSNQIAVVTVKSLAGYKAAEFTRKLGEKWGVGQKEFDNGVVIMVKPTGGAGERHTFIAIGYGLEDVLTAEVCQQIVDQIMIPEFKKGNFYTGITEASVVIQQLAAGEISVANFQGRRSYSFLMILIFLLLGLLGVIIIVWIIEARQNAIVNGTSFLWSFSTLSSKGRCEKHRNHYYKSGGMFGGGGSGDSGAGGAGAGGSAGGGFGGGGFGGGGAGGSW